MESELAIEASREAIKVCLIVGGPILAVCLIVGLLMGLAQAMSHIQDQALATIPKILAIFAVVGFALPWFADRMIDFSEQQFSRPMLAVGAPLMESESSDAFRPLFDHEAASEDSYYPHKITTTMKQASFIRERGLPQKSEFEVPLPEVWNPPAVEKSANPFQLPSHRFSRRPNANIEG